MRLDEEKPVKQPEEPTKPKEIPNIEKYRATFQKPSQIYKFLAEIWKTKPLFLVRTLTTVRKCPSPIQRKYKREPASAVWERLRQRASPRANGSSRRTPEQAVKPSRYECRNHSGGSDSQDRPSCYYKWICDDAENTQTTTISTGYVCAWCERDFGTFNALVTHLRCNHQRISVQTSVSSRGHQVIELSLNPSFDGSYCGFKYPGHDFRRDFTFRPKAPERKNPSTQLIYLRPMHERVHVADKPESDVAVQIVDEEADVDVCSGRLYYHTSTCLPVKPNECDIDSEADMDPLWLRERTQLMINEFIDVNEGEKEMLKLWNLHIMANYKYKGDHHIRQACLDFIDSEGQTILSKNLSRNFYLHLANLFDFGLLSSGDMIECIRKLKKLKRVGNPVSPSKSNGKRNNNGHYQHSPPAKRALLN